MADIRLSGGFGAVHRSFSARLALLVAIFLAVPVIVYSEFRDADAEKIALLQKNTEAEGRLIAMALTPILRTFDGSTANRTAEEARRFTQPGTVVRVLLRPKALGEDASLFIVAAAPPLTARRLDAERQRLVKAGIFRRIGPGCEAVAPEAQRYTNVSGAEEVLTSMVPFLSNSGCWVVLVSKSTDDVLQSSLGRPYWKSAEVRIATAIYLLFACVVFWMFLDVWRNLRRFARLARDIRTGQSGELSFEDHNRVPEISGVATEFDRLVLGLWASARSIREAAEDNAHALKGPLAVISQSVEPLKRVAGSECEAGKVLARIERSTERLDSLVSASRQLDNATAELMEAPRERVDLTALVTSLAVSLESNHDDRDIRIVTDADDGLKAWGSDGLFETVIENLVENALGYSPAGGKIHLSLHRVDGMAELSVIDEGPGVDQADLDRIFERYFTDRASSAMANGSDHEPAHFGIGLWIVRRNVEALGGSAMAENVPDAGLKVTLRVPLAD